MVINTFQLEFGGIAWTLNPDGTQLHELTECTTREPPHKQPIQKMQLLITSVGTGFTL